MKSNIIFFIIIIIIITGYAISFRHKPSYNRVPRKIWTYWDNSDKIPKTVKLCMESWKKHNPDYEITLLTKKNFYSYVNIPKEISSHPNFNDNPARFSDLVCLSALAEHGGIWIDASVLLKAPLDTWMFPKYAEFSGFYMELFTKPDMPPVIENWFLACNKNSEFIKLWHQEFIQMAHYPTVEHYIQSLKKLGVDFQNISDPNYSAIHISAQKVLQIDKYPVDPLILKKSEDGPVKYLVDAKWNSEKALNVACKNKKYQSPIMKMRDEDRKFMEEHLDYELSTEKCEWI